MILSFYQSPLISFTYNCDSPVRFYSNRRRDIAFNLAENVLLSHKV